MLTSQLNVSSLVESTIIPIPTNMFVEDLNLFSFEEMRMI